MSRTPTTFLEAMRQAPEKLELLPANGDLSIMSREQRERAALHEQINHQRARAHFDQLESQPKEA